MSQATTTRRIDLTALSWPATSRGNEQDGFTIEATSAPDDATLQAEVDAAPNAPEPVDRLAALEARVDAAAALAEDANATAQEVANAMKPSGR